MFIPEGPDLKLKRFPWATFSLIVLITDIYFACLGSDDSTLVWIDKHLVFHPANPSILASIASMFLHGGAMHLISNMFFLWIFGSYLEDKIGWIKYLVLYFITGIIADVIFALIQFPVDARRLKELFDFKEEELGCIGASGAISGIMGVYFSRCYYSKIKFVIGLGPFIIPKRFKVHAAVLLGFWFLSDLKFGFEILNGLLTPIAVWAHIGGFLCGLLIGKYLKFGVEANKERLLERGTKLLCQGIGYSQAKEDFNKVIELDPDNVEAHYSLARLYAGSSDYEKGEPHYRKAIFILLKKKDKKVIDLCKEHFHNYRSSLPPQIQFKICQ